MKLKNRMIGYYNYTVVLTYIGMLTGFIGILFAFEERTINAIFCLIIAGFCDMFDGAIASTKVRTEQEKSFGIQIDSLSDLICFCVLPAFIVYSVSTRSIVVTVICALYVLCGLIRLAYFNVDEQERQKSSSTSREVYHGMPVTLAALFLPLAYGINYTFPETLAYLKMVLCVMGVLFLIPFPLRKPHLVGKLCVLMCGVAEVVLVSVACLGL